jgi:peptide/nickel transport system substrate-binding protein/oligopeptide transport system substrate-binding protein
MPQVSADGKTYTFKVKQGLKWSDGTPITSQTFAYSIDRAESPCTASPAAYYLYSLKDAVDYNTVSTCSNGVVKGKITTLINDSIQTPDAQTLVLTLAQPATYFLEAMTYPTSYAVPQQLISKYPTDWTKHLADGTGFGGNLYKITSWNHSGNLTLDRNDSFWGTKPKLREISITFYKDTTTAYNSYLAGKDDIGGAPTAQLAAAKTHAGFHQIGVQQIDYDELEDGAV